MTKDLRERAEQWLALTEAGTHQRPVAWLADGRQLVRDLFAAVGALQQQLDTLHGAKFSDRTYAALKSRTEAAEAQLQALRQFALAVLDGYRTGACGDIDGGWLQDKALELGLLVAGTANADGDVLYHIAATLTQPGAASQETET